MEKSFLERAEERAEEVCRLKPMSVFNLGLQATMLLMVGGSVNSGNDLGVYLSLFLAFVCFILKIKYIESHARACYYRGRVDVIEEVVKFNHKKDKKEQ